MNRIKTYGIPEEIQKNNRYTVKVRPAGEEAWTEIECYTVKIDMHEVRDAAMTYFDFEGEVDVAVSLNENFTDIYRADIRPLSKKIPSQVDGKTLTFRLSEPANLSVEINGDRFHNLHVFAGKPEEYTYDEENAVVMHQHFGDAESLPAGKTIVFEPGVHYIEEVVSKIPSDTDIFLQGGAVIVGAFVCENVQNVRIYGRGVIFQGNQQWYTSVNGVKISNSKNVTIDGITFIDPPHYTVFVGGSEHISIHNVKTFSCSKWTDGFDIMSGQDIRITGSFLRTSDDCIAIYGSRWRYRGDTQNVLVEDCVLWADVAHPTNIGGHGDYENDGDIIENIVFRNIDILEHHERQMGYLGCLSINAGDKNLVQNVLYEDIRIEHFEHGKIFDFQIKFNPKYNPAPGKGIAHVTLRNVSYTGYGAERSVINGYDKAARVEHVLIERLTVNGKHIRSAEEGDIEIGSFTNDIRFL